MAGLVVGITRFAWSSAYPLVFCEAKDDMRPAVIKNVHYLHFGILLFSLVVIVTVVVSLLTEPIDDKHVSRTKLLSLCHRRSVARPDSVLCTVHCNVL